MDVLADTDTRIKKVILANKLAGRYIGLYGLEKTTLVFWSDITNLLSQLHR